MPAPTESNMLFVFIIVLLAGLAARLSVKFNLNMRKFTPIFFLLFLAISLLHLTDLESLHQVELLFRSLGVASTGVAGIFLFRLIVRKIEK
ncbi:hypothetical protein [Serpentinimonas maccroryi]|jgi:predicted neutral ceramidase superfamily lipid hydrolase|uniref:hypothetical protein n=1 Tax=Serpentinimonas maccroryi TaxID=1458426 RepID=UPI002034663D|nr:hypothetical protein [Serpentinimonas maccroryi]MCM2480248.1 hypothetical protein [Serpentinimonas maccroryi]